MWQKRFFKIQSNPVLSITFGWRGRKKHKKQKIIDWLHCLTTCGTWELPRWHNGKESTYQCRRRKRRGFDPWVRKILWNGKWNPLQHSCLENFMERGAWQATIHGVTKSQTWLSFTHTKCPGLRFVTWGEAQSPDLLLSPGQGCPIRLFWSCARVLSGFSCVQLCDPKTAARQAPLSVEISRQAYWSGCHALLQGIFPALGSDAPPGKPCFWSYHMPTYLKGT